MRRTAILIPIVLAASLSAIAQSDNSAKAPTISLKDLDGKTVRLSDYKGKVVLLNFWAVWCVPCAAEVPQLVKWQAEYKDSGLQIIGVTYPPTSLTKTRRFIKKNNVTYPVLLGAKGTKALVDNSENLPVTLVIDRKGNIAARIDGIIFDEEFDTKLKPLLTKQ